MGLIEDAKLVYQNAIVHALIPPNLRPRREHEEAMENLDLTELEHGTNPALNVSIDGMIAQRFVRGNSDFIRGTQPGTERRVRNAHTYQRYSRQVTLTATNGTQLDSSTSFIQDGIDVGVCDCLVFNGSFRSNVCLLYSVDKPVTHAKMDNLTFVPQADIFVASLGAAGLPAVPVTLYVPRGHHRVYVGMYVGTANQAAPYSDTCNFIAINTGR